MLPGSNLLRQVEKKGACSTLSPIHRTTGKSPKSGNWLSLCLEWYRDFTLTMPFRLYLNNISIYSWKTVFLKESAINKAWILQQCKYDQLSQCKCKHTRQTVGDRQRQEAEISVDMLVIKYSHFFTRVTAHLAPSFLNSYIIHTRRILHKAEPTCCFLHFIQAHNDFLYVTTFTEEFIDLFFSCVKWKISNIQCTAFFQ